MSATVDGILLLYRNNLDYAQRLVADLDDDALALQPAAEMNHAAWVLGHLATVSDRVAGGMLLGLTPRLPDQWDELFGVKSIPTDERARYPGKQDLVEALIATHGVIDEKMGEMSDDLLAQPTSHERFAKRFPQMVEALIHVLVGHEQMHLGQLSAWRRVQGMARV